MGRSRPARMPPWVFHNVRLGVPLQINGFVVKLQI